MPPRSPLFTTSSLRRLSPRFSSSAPWVCRSCQVRIDRNRNRNRHHSSHAPSPSEKPFYVTSPIFYVNAAPHVGHLYTMVLADILKRWQQVKGREAILSTGVDEHGLKIQKASEKAGIEPKLFCDKGATIFKELAQKADIANDHFVRTTDEIHKDAVQYAWYLLQEKGYVYTAKHEGWYSVSDETFYPESAVQKYLDPPTGKKIMTSIETGSEVEWASETNYHFKLSAFREELLDFYKENPEWIFPASRMDDVVREVESGLDDLSISRPTERLSWGIRVPQDETQTVYVWLDALMNYATKAGYPWPPGTELSGGWPADCHVIGKDIVRFHCIYWPAFLMALGLPLPKKILTHAHWTLGGSKMSKSTGKVVDPFSALERFGPDTMRFFLAYDGGLQNDADYDNVRIILRYNKILHGGFGNLASRVLRFQKWSVRGAIERVSHNPPSHWEYYGFYRNTLSAIPSLVADALDSCDPRKALRHLVVLMNASNQFIAESSPWDKILPFGPREPGVEVDEIIFLAVEGLRISGILLQPYMPNKAKMLLDQLGVAESRRTFEFCQLAADLDYGVPLIPLGRKHEGVLFPPLPSQE